MSVTKDEVWRHKEALKLGDHSWSWTGLMARGPWGHHPPVSAEASFPQQRASGEANSDRREAQATAPFLSGLLGSRPFF